MNYVMLGLWIALAAVQVGLLFSIRKTRRVQATIEATQAEITARQAFITKALEAGRDRHLAVMQGGWRDLDAHSQHMLRMALTQVLAEMESAPSATRH